MSNRILIISPECSSFKKGYQIICHQLLQFLKKKCVVDFVSSVYFSDKYFAKTDNHKKKQNLYIFKYNKLKRISNLLTFSIANEPVENLFYKSNQIKRKVADLLLKNKYKCIICILTRSVQYLPKFAKYPVICIAVDPIFSNYKTLAKKSTCLKKFVYYFEALKILLYEKKIDYKIKNKYYVSFKDVEICKKKYGFLNSQYLGYGVTIPKKIISFENRKPLSLIFSGNLSYPPNEISIKRFVFDCMPIIKERNSKVCLYIVGRNPSQKIINLQNSNIKVFSNVTCIYSYLQKALVSICPLFTSTGVQTKILEAFACGTPVIASKAAANGLFCKNNLDIKIYDNTHQLVEYIFWLFEKKNWEKISSNARKYVKNNHKWSSVFSRIKELNTI